MLKNTMVALTGAVAVSVGIGGSAEAATFTVSNFDDAGIGSLRQAIEDANNQAGADVINFDSGIGSGIVSLLIGELSITDDLTINGPGEDQVAVDAGGLSRVFRVDDFDDSRLIDVSISGLTITGGFASGGNVSGDGAGVFNKEILLIRKSTVTANQSDRVNAGVFNLNPGELTVIDSTISNNIGPFGAGLRNLGGNAKVINSVISGNSATAFGGGIDNFGGSLEVTNSTISGNTAFFGGGIGVGGQGLGQVRIISSTIVNNTAYGEGGGVLNNDTTFISNSIVAENQSSVGSDVLGSFNSEGYNLIGISDGSDGFGAIGDRVGDSSNPISPKLGPLQDNGGPTPTQALLPGSPAIDAANPNDFPDTDQRGVSRPQGSAPDIGAFELRESVPEPVPEPASLLGLAAIGAVAASGALKKKAA